MVFPVSAHVVKKAMDRLLFRIIFLRMFVQQTALGNGEKVFLWRKGLVSSAMY